MEELRKYDVKNTNEVYQAEISFAQDNELTEGIWFAQDNELNEPITFPENEELTEGIWFEESTEVQLNEKNINPHKLEYSNNNFKVIPPLNLYNGYEYVNLMSTINIADIQDESKLIRICNFVVEPISVVVVDDGVNKEYSYKIKCILENEMESKIITLKPSDLLNSNWIKSKLGIKYYVEGNVKEYKQLEIYIAENSKTIEEEIEYKMVGWKYVDDRWVYLHGGGAIGTQYSSNLQGSKDKTIECINISSYKAIHEALKLLEISNDLSKTLPMFLFAHLSVVKELFMQAGVEPKFCLWIYGLTGSMKTSVSKVFFNIFNTGEQQNITSTFKDTITAIELKSFEFKDSVLLVDDFHPTTSAQEKREMHRLASEILRRYGDGICKSRGTKYMTKQKEFPPRGLCVITGEDKIGGESTVARYIGIEVKRGDFKSKELSYFQNNPCLFSTHIYHFIDWVAYNFEFLKGYVSKQFMTSRNENIGNFRHGRMNEAFAILRVIADVFLIYIEKNEIITLQDKEDILFDWTNILFEIIRTHENSNIQQSPTIMYLTAIKELVGCGKLSLTKIKDYKEQKDKETNVGYESEDKIYLIPKLVYAEVKSFWKSQGIEFPVSEETVNKMLDENGILEVKFEGKTRRRTIKISGDNRRFLVIDKAKMESMLEEID